MSNLSNVWNSQKTYNNRIKSIQDRTTADWMQTYILGVISECGELLREIRWKNHRVENRSEFSNNVSEELADLTKYIFSMWDQMGYEPHQMLDFVQRKTDWMDFLHQQEHRDPWENECILMLDLDGVVADFREGFIQYVSSPRFQEFRYDHNLEESLHMDINQGWRLDRYEEIKDQFEKEGGYGRLPSFRTLVDQLDIFRDQTHSSVKVVVYTARPGKRLKRVGYDTWEWLEAEGIHIDEIHYGSEERVRYALSLAEKNRVIALEDNPILAGRYGTSGIETILIDQPYNREVSGWDNVIRLEKEEWRHLWTILSQWRLGSNLCEIKWRRSLTDMEMIA